MIHLQPTGRAAAGTLLAGLLLAGCGSTPAAPDAALTGPTGAPTSQPEPSSRSRPPAAEPDGPVELPWPAASASDAAALQAAADDGAQPWLLDPSEVAMSYAAAAHGWADAEAYPGPDGTSVDVRNPDGERRTLTLAQPGRTGGDGVWVVTADQPS